MEISSYPPGCSGTPWDETEFVDLMPAMKNYGKRDGDRVLLCGKDADLDPGGQIAVINAWLNEDTGKITAEMYVYANICEPCQKEDAEGYPAETEEEWETRKDEAGEIVGTWDDYPGEWTGDDYWVYWLQSEPLRVLSGPKSYKVECDGVSTKSQEEGLDMTPEELNEQAGVIVEAIFADQAILDFQANMAELSKIIDAL